MTENNRSQTQTQTQVDPAVSNPPCPHPITIQYYHCPSGYIVVCEEHRTVVVSNSLILRDDPTAPDFPAAADRCMDFIQSVYSQHGIATVRKHSPELALFIADQLEENLKNDGTRRNQ